ncbi:ABC transporter permease [Nocardiopsis aegyptia]|uniref:NitT/TauT family transport system permease protein n=1 Tax=Nocardiopsis aegyptia TaxID=220378 RepID=A0A7Z0JB25_9ACTN|nr:ABC transporter permease subunit [Nocardiopsis aegyptia]NYJ35014.1 NitT/TauT family transport system permease protein [Nocardiopsis aegyptia]
MTELSAVPQRRTGLTHRIDRLWPPVLFAALGVACWWAIATALKSTIVPTPAAAVAGLWAELGNSGFQASVLDTVRVLVLAYAAAAAVGAIAGTLLGVRAFWSRAILPLVHALNSVPKVTLFPIFLLLLGLGDVSRGAFAFACGVLPMFIIAAEAAHGVSRTHLKLASSLGVGEIQVMRKIVWPSALPAIATGLRLSFGFTFLGLIIAEMFAGSSGVGQELLRNVSTGRMENIAGEVILIAAIALAPTVVLTRIERWTADRYGYNGS